MPVYDFNAFLTVRADDVEEAKRIADALNGGPLLVNLGDGKLAEATFSLDDGEPEELDDDLEGE